MPECLEVTAQTEKDNIASIRVLEKLGFSMVREMDDEFCWIVTRTPGSFIPEFDGK